MGIFDIFQSDNNAGQQPPAPQQQPQQQAATGQPGNIPPPADPAAPGQGQVPASQQQDAQAASEENSPLAQFEKLWEPVTPDPAKSGATPPAELNAEDVQKAVSKADFTSSITPEQLQAISQGGEEAQQAFAQALNSVAQQVMTQTTLVSNKLTEKAVKEALEAERANIPTLLRDQAATSHLSDTNPIFNNPAVKPVVEATKQQLLQKFPNATPAEITQMTQDYILAMGEAFSPESPTPAGEEDWNKFLGGA